MIIGDNLIKLQKIVIDALFSYLQAFSKNLLERASPRLKNLGASFTV